MAKVFSGGMCNYINEAGATVRNPGRDGINQLLRSRGHEVFDPQIDEVSHGRKYDYTIDGPAEQQARAEADVLLYEVGHLTMGGVSALEIVRDASQGRKVIVWLTGDVDAKGKAIFVPAGAKVDSIDDAATKAHFQQFVKQANSMRNNVRDWLLVSSNVRFVRTVGELKDAFNEFGVRN